MGQTQLRRFLGLGAVVWLVVLVANRDRRNVVSDSR